MGSDAFTKSTSQEVRITILRTRFDEFG